MAPKKTKPGPLPARAPKPSYSSQPPEVLSGLFSGFKELSDLGKGAVSRIGERLRTIRRSTR